LGWHWHKLAEAFTRLNPWILMQIRRNLHRWNRAAETIPAALDPPRHDQNSPRKSTGTCIEHIVNSYHFVYNLLFLHVVNKYIFSY
jgi:hypothetical protein